MDDIDKAKFHVKFIKGEMGRYNGVLVVNSEVYNDFFGDNISCQICGCSLANQVFYFCKERPKWYCKKCELKVNCVVHTFKNPEHSHFCIRKIEIKD